VAEEDEDIVAAGPGDWELAGAVTDGVVKGTTGENNGGELVDSMGNACSVEIIDGPCSSQKWAKDNYN